MDRGRADQDFPCGKQAGKHERHFPAIRQTRNPHRDDFASLRYVPLSQLDSVADSFRFGSSFLLGAEGAVLGGVTTIAEGIPGAQLVIPSLILTDITTSMTLLSRHTCRIATAYGFPSSNPEHLPHLVAAMAPQTDDADEGYLSLKTAVVTSIRESSQFLSRMAGVVVDRQILEREAPQMIRLITYVADRLGVVVTQKELGILVPVAGAVLNSSINLAFQQVGHQTAKDYFRRLLLEERYGEDLVGVRDPAGNSRIAGLRLFPIQFRISDFELFPECGFVQSSNF